MQEIHHQLYEEVVDRVNAVFNDPANASMSTEDVVAAAIGGLTQALYEIIEEHHDTSVHTDGIPGIITQVAMAMHLMIRGDEDKLKEMLQGN